MFKYGHLSLKLEDVVVVSFAMSGFLLMSPFFIWSTYSKILSSGFSIGVTALSVVLSLLWKFYDNTKISFSRKQLLFLLLTFSVFVIEKIIFSEQNIFGNLITSIHFLAIVIFAFFPYEMKKKIYSYFVTVYVISLIPALICYLFNSIGVSFPSTLLLNPIDTLSSLGKNYNLSVLSVTIVGRDFRLCGMFDEPGVVGTISALILFSERYRIRKNWKNIILLISGILSFSLAFLIITLVGVFLILFQKKDISKFLYIAVGVAFVLFILYGDFDNQWLSTMQRRLAFSNGVFSGYNRSSTQFATFFDDILHNNPVSLLWGHEMNEYVKELCFGASDFRVSIYQYGLIDFVLVLLWVRCNVELNNTEKKYILPSLIVVLCSIIQRPAIVTLYYTIIISGINFSLLEFESKENAYYKIEHLP